MIIEITTDLILKLRKVDFYPDEMFSLLFILKALEDNSIGVLDAYDDFTSSKRAIITYQKLFRLGFLEKAKEGSATFFKITEKGKEFLKTLEPKNWLKDWVDLFPENNQNGVLRSDLEDVEPRMKSFIKKYKYDKELIVAATKAYITKESSKNYEYTKRAMFFIDKRGEGSLLAAWCKLMADYKAKTGKLYDGKRTEIIQTVN